MRSITFAGCARPRTSSHQKKARGRRNYAGRAVVCAAFAAATAALPSPGSAQTTTWNGTVGDWFNSANWSAGVPTLSHVANVNSGTAQIAGGLAEANALRVGLQAGSGAVEQTAGALTTTTSSVGSFSTPGLFTQTGGQHGTGTLNIGFAGRYAFSGGTLDVASGLSNSGTLDFSGATGASLLLGGITDLSAGTMLAPAQVDVSVKANSLLVLPTGFNPNTGFHSFTSTGLVHNAGSTLTVPAGVTISGNGTIPDFTNIDGSMSGNITFSGGVMVRSGGALSMPGATLLLSNHLSGVSGGDADIDYIWLGFSNAASFRVTSGSLDSSTITIGTGNIGSSTFTQEGGTVTTFGLDIAESSPGSYLLSNGSLNVSSIRVGVGGRSGTLVQTGGTLTSGGVPLVMGISASTNATSVYQLSAGSATFSRVTLGPVGAINSSARITQSGGTYTVLDDELISGIVTLSGGTHTVADTLTIGFFSAGSFTQTGGTLSAGRITVNSSRILDQSSGTLTAGIIDVGGVLNHTGGNLSVTNQLNVSGTLAHTGGTLSASTLEFQPFVSVLKARVDAASPISSINVTNGANLSVSTMLLVELAAGGAGLNRSALKRKCSIHGIACAAERNRTSPLSLFCGAI